jgi:nitrate reductase gamma subunit
MFFKFALYISLIIFGTGMVYKLSAWFWQKIGTGEKDIPISSRINGAVKGVGGILISLKLLTLIKAFFLDVLLQTRILKDQDDRILWIMHLLIFIGFIMLILMHALGSIITTSLFPDYQPTLNPFLFLRNLLGLFVIAGLALAVVRRALYRRERIMTSAMDYYVIIILAVIVISGFLLEATKISSHSTFQRMVEDYGDLSERKELEALEGYWVRYFGLVSPEISGALSKSSLEQGRDLHEKSCAACHSRPHWAPISYSLSGSLRVFALAMDRAGGQTALWYLHFMACFIGLVYLPFSK